MHNRYRKKAHITILKTELAFISAAVILSAFVLGFFAGKGDSGAAFELAPLPYTVQSGGAVSLTAAPDSPKASGSAGTSVDSQGRININTAAAPELITLPGIGEVLAGMIIAYREENGGFKNIYELMDVSGIGEKTFAKLEAMVYVD